MKYALPLALLAISCAFAVCSEDVSFVPSADPLAADISARIINGQHAQPNQFPWFVAINGVLLNSQRILCGGALISGTFVLTSAQCVQNPQ